MWKGVQMQMPTKMPMKKIEDPDRKHFYWRCETCGYQTGEKEKTSENVDDQPHRCPRCGN
jgi:predicted SprT family Zn-dependent metalloprotease